MTQRFCTGNYGYFPIFLNIMSNLFQRHKIINFALMGILLFMVWKGLVL